MAVSYAIKTDGEFPVIDFLNYCTNESLEGIAEKVSALCDEDRTQIIFDFSGCQVINSLGIATLLEVLMIVQDYEGTAVITGLDAAKKKFFSLTGVFSVAESSDDQAQAVEILRG